jgi:hypothetical protein
MPEETLEKYMVSVVSIHARVLLQPNYFFIIRSGLSMNFFVKVFTPAKENVLKTFLSHDSEESFSLQFSRDELHSPKIKGTGEGHSPRLILHTHDGSMYNSTDDDSSSSLPLWTSTTVCFLFRTPFFEELSQVLTFAYENLLEEELDRWETAKQTRIENLFRQFQIAKDQQQEQQQNASGEQEKPKNDKSFFSVYTVGSQYSLNLSHLQLSDETSEDNPLWNQFYTEYARNYFQSSLSFPPCRVLLEKLICFLFSECPKPIPNLLSISVNFTHAAAENHSEKYFNSLSQPEEHEIIPKHLFKQIYFSAQNPEFLPNPSNRFSFILRCFGPRVMLDILNNILSESRMIFYSRDLNKLANICEGFRLLIFPLIWTHVYLPIVPVQLLNLIEAPVPFLLGTHSDNLYHMNLYNVNDIILIDCDNGILMENNNSAATQNMSSPVKLPEKEDRWLMLSLKELQKTIIANNNSASLDRGEVGEEHASNAHNYSWKEIHSADVIIQLLIYDVLIRFFRFIPDCLFYLSTNCPIFNRPLFLMEYTPNDYKNTLENLSITNAFHVLTENVYSDTKKFYLFCLKKLDEEENEEGEEVSTVEDIDGIVSLNNGSNESTMSPERKGGHSNDSGLDIYASPNDSIQKHHDGRGLSNIFSNSANSQDFQELNSISSATNRPFASSTLPPVVKRFSHDVPTSPGEFQPSLSSSLKLAAPEKGIDLQARSNEVVGYSAADAIIHGAASAESELGGDRGGGGGRPELTRGVSISRPHKALHQASSGGSLIRKISSNMILLDSSSHAAGNASPGTGKGNSNNNSGVFSPTGGHHGSYNTPGQVSRSASGTIGLTKSFLRMDNSPIFCRQISQERPAVHQPFHVSPFAGLLPEWIIDTDTPTPHGNKENSADYLLFLIEERMCYYRRIIKEYLNEDINRMYSSSGRLQEDLRLREKENKSVFYHFEFQSAITITEDSPNYTKEALEIEKWIALSPQVVQIKQANEVAVEQSSVHNDSDVPDEIVKINSEEINLGIEPSGSLEATSDENFFKDEKKSPIGVISPQGDTDSTPADSFKYVGQLQPLGKPKELSQNQVPTSPTVLLNPEKELLLFDQLLVAKAQEKSTFWTLSQLAEKFHFTEEEFIAALKKSTYSLLHEAEDDDHQNPSQALTRGTSSYSIGYRQNSFSTNPLPASREWLSDKSSPDAIITDFLQLLLTVKDIDEEIILQSMGKCDLALEKHVNRTSFIQLLKNAKKDRQGKGRSSKSNKQENLPTQEQNVYPLHTTAFECISQLFLRILTICNEQNDYINAFQLLEIGGHYFHLISLAKKRQQQEEGFHHRRDKTGGDKNNDKNQDQNEFEFQTVEFLSERICHHPIYHLSSMWKGLLLDRLPLQQTVPTVSKSISQAEEDTTNVSVKLKKYHINVIMAEIRSLLYMMLDLGVNSARALHFVQSITADYRLTINEYLNLQRFTTNLWSQHNNEADGNHLMTNQEYDVLESQNQHLFHPSQPTVPDNNTTSNPVQTSGSVQHSSSQNDIILQAASSGSLNNALKKKKSSHHQHRDHHHQQRRASTAGISELMMKHGHANPSQKAPSLSRSGTNLTTDSNDANPNGRSQRSISNRSQDNLKELSASGHLSFSLSNSHDVAGAGGRISPVPHNKHLPHQPSSSSSQRHHSLPNPHRVDSFYSIPSVDSHPDGHGAAQSEASSSPFPSAQLTENTKNTVENEANHVPQAPSPEKELSPAAQILASATTNSMNKRNDHNRSPTPSGNLPVESISLTKSHASGENENSSEISLTPEKQQLPTDAPEHHYHFSSYDLLSAAASNNNNATNETNREERGKSVGSGSVVTAEMGKTTSSIEDELSSHHNNQQSQNYNSTTTPRSSSSAPPSPSALNKKLCDLSIGYYPQEIKGLESDNNVNQMTTLGNWLILGNDESMIEVVDLRNFSIAGKLKHGASSFMSSSSSTTTTTAAGRNNATPAASTAANKNVPSAIHGVTALNVLEDDFYYENYENNYNHDYVFFSGCENGLIKVWNLPDLSYHYHPTDRNDYLFMEEEERLQLQHYLEEEKELEKRERNKNSVDGGVRPEDVTSEDGKPRSSLVSFFSGSSNTTTSGNSTQQKRSSKTGLFWGTSAAETTSTKNAAEAYNEKTRAFPPHLTAQSKIKIKQSSVMTMKTHSAMITSIISQPHPDHLSGWILASGDSKGDLTIVKSNDGCTIDSTVGINVQSASSTAGGVSSKNSKFNSIQQSSSSSINDYTISSMSFFAPHQTYDGSAHSQSAAAVLPAYLIVGNYLGILNIIDINYGRSVYQSQGHLLKINKIVNMRNCNQFLSCSNDRNILLWDIRMKQPVNTPREKNNNNDLLLDLPFHIEERCLGYAINSMSDHLHSSPNPFSSGTSIYSNSVFNVTHPHRSSLLSPSSNNPNNSYQQFQYYQQLSYKKSSSAPVTDMAVGGLDSSVVVSTSADGIIKLWDLRYNLMTPYQTIMNGHYPNRITSVIWDKKKHSSGQSNSNNSTKSNGNSSSFDEFFYTASYDGTVRSWDVINGKNNYSFNVPLNKLRSTATPAASSMGNSFMMGMSSMMKTTTNQLMQSLHGVSLHGGNKILNEEKIVQMMKPSFFYEDAVTNATTKSGDGKVTGAEEGSTKNGWTKAHRNCLVTRNCFGSVQLFVNNSIHPSSSGRGRQRSSSRSSFHAGEESTHSSHAFYSNSDHIFV